MKIFKCIPKQVVIGWQTYDVDFKSPDTHLVGEVKEGVFLGNIYYSQSLIVINNTPDEDVMESTLLHEIIHGIDNFMTIGLDEDTISKISDGLSLFITQNPGLLR